MIPAIGDIVLYTSLGDADGRFPAEQHPALVTKVSKRVADYNHENEAYGYELSLTIFYETGTFNMTEVPFSEGFFRGRWSWRPERPTSATTVNPPILPFKLIVNGRERAISLDRLSYRQVVDMAGMVGNPTVVWRLSNGNGGSLTPGKWISIHSDMVFSVAHTGNA
jgi:hypothetical protein